MLVGTSVGKCTAGRHGDAVWTGDVLVEYPVGSLKGDLNNALWERRRSLREAEVLVASARSFFNEGRWLAGLSELARARALIGRLDGPVDISGSGDTEEGRVEQVRALVEETARRVVSTLKLHASGPVVSIGASVPVDVVLEFCATFEWEGERVRAAGVPIECSMLGGAAVLGGQRETDRAGTAGVVVSAAYGPGGDRIVLVAVDSEVVSAATRGLLELGDLVQASVHRVVRVVRGEHGISVCFDLRSPREGEAAARGVAGRCAGILSSDGYAVGECSADVDIVVSGEVELSTESSTIGWTATVVVRARAFDQWVGRDIGEIVIDVTEPSAEGPREAAALAQHEAGRLLASYLTERIMLGTGR